MELISLWNSLVSGLTASRSARSAPRRHSSSLSTKSSIDFSFCSRGISIRNLLVSSLTSRRFPEQAAYHGKRRAFRAGFIGIPRNFGTLGGYANVPDLAHSVGIDA